MLLAGVLLPSSNPLWPAADTELSPESLARLEAMPDDPDYAPRPDPVLGCGGQLELYSFTPACTPGIAARERALGLGAGIHADRAWLWTTGRPEVTIAIVDSGVDWSNVDLVNRWRLNPGELDPPEVPGGSQTHDANGDGIFNVQDYTTATGTVVPTLDKVIDARLLRRPDRGDANHNGILDPEDLILIFSNGKDDDQNGYVDDICGWDFLQNTNDPRDPDPPSSHGTRQALIAVATANNGSGGAGVCPSCSAIPVRAEVDRLAGGIELARAITFSVDASASVIATAAAAAGGSGALQSAVNYAWSSARPDAPSRGVLIVAAAGNASSPRAEVPWDPARVLVVGSIGHDRQPRDLATSAVAPDPCSNFGVQLAISAPGRCDTTAAALTAGAAGLVLSASRGNRAKSIRAIAPVLAAGELRQLLILGADEIASSIVRGGAPPLLPSAAPAQVIEGFDPRVGYGRLNARRAIDLVVQQRIPLETEIVKPDWLTMIDPTPISRFEVSGRVINLRNARVSWVFELALGSSPLPDAFSPIGSGVVEAQQTADVTGTVPTEGLFKDPTEPPATPSDFFVTLRLSATAAIAGTIVRGESRRVILIHRDIDLFPGFPLALGAGAVGSPRLVDFDQGGQDQIVVATDDGRVSVLGPKGRARAGWPVDTGEPIVATPAIGALNAAATPKQSVVVVAASGRTFAYDDSGHLLPGFPIPAPSTSSAARAPGVRARAPVLFDLDRDGTSEIIQATAGGAIVVFDRMGRLRPGFPVELPEPVGMPAVGDIDGDGTFSIVAASATRLYAIYADGDRHPGSPQHPGSPIVLPAPSVERRPEGFDAMFPPAPVLGDVDGDRIADIVLSTPGRPVLAFRGGGGSTLRMVASSRGEAGERSKASREGDPLFALPGHTAVADFGDNRLLSVAHGIAGAGLLAGADPAVAVEHLFGVWSLFDGKFVAGAPRELGRSSPGGAAIADLDGDHRPELVIADASGRIEAFNAFGTVPRQWPKLTGGWVPGAVALGDFDGDRRIDVVAITRNGLVFAWRGRAVRPGSFPWAGFQHDNRATGNVTSQDGVIQKRRVGSSCSCNATSSRAAGGAVGLGLAAISIALGRARRNRRGDGAL